MTPKQARFVAEYMIDLNATQAAIRAGYSEKTAYSIGQQNLKKVEIAAAIARRQAGLARKLDVTTEAIVEELAKIAFATIPHEHVKVAEKRAALVDLGKHLGIFKEKNQHEVHAGGDLDLGFRELARAFGAESVPLPKPQFHLSESPPCR